MGIKLTEKPKEKILSLKELKKIPPVTNRLKEACFDGADLNVGSINWITGRFIGVSKGRALGPCLWMGFFKSLVQSSD